MKSGYKIFWTNHALWELEQTILYLEENWTSKEIENLAIKIEETILFLSQNPQLFQIVDTKKHIRRAVVLKHNTLYFRINKKNVEIVSFFSNRQNPNKKKII